MKTLVKANMSEEEFRESVEGFRRYKEAFDKSREKPSTNKPNSNLAKRWAGEVMNWNFTGKSRIKHETFDSYEEFLAVYSKRYPNVKI